MASTRSGSFGEMLQRYRLTAGLTQEELAERARLSARAISDLERGAKTRPHLATIRQLAEALELSETERGALQLAARGYALSPPGGDWAPGVHTFLIADVRGYTQFTLDQGDEAAAHLATRFAQLVEETVAAWDGRVVELRGDEALVVFSSARQALRAAVELQARLAEDRETVPLGVGIGLDAGEAVSVGGGYRGTALNLAARLCSLAQAGEVLASDGVIHLARKVDGLTYVERGMGQLKGFVDPVKVIQVTVSPHESPGPAEEPVPAGKQQLPVGGFLGSLPSGALVARDEELARMLSAVEHVASGAGRLVLLGGEPGAGKTRLAQEVTLEVGNRGFLVVAGRCYEPQQAVPFYPFLEALTTAYTLAAPSTRADLLKRWPGVVQLLPSLALPHQDYAAPQDQQRLFWAVTGFFQAVAAVEPLAILLDDLHWVDAASLDLLQHLARHTRKDRILLLGTYRDVDLGRHHPLEAAIRDLAREGIVERLLVRRLAPAGTAALIAATLGETSVSPGLAELVHDRTEGNPFFVQQVVRMLIERGDILSLQSRLDRKAVDEIEVPDTIRSVIDQRLSRLSETTQEVLHEASALGQTFTFEDLQGMAGRHEHEVEDALEEAMAVGLIRFRGSTRSAGDPLRTGRDVYGFDHALTQQALYSHLSSRRKRRLHLAAAEAIEQSSPDAERRAGELAWHFLEADEPSRALAYSIVAGDQAEAVFAHDDASSHYHTALTLAQQLQDTEREAAIRERLGGLLTAVIRYGEALSMLEQAAKMYGATGDREAEARVVAQIGRVHVAGGSIERGVDLLEETLASFTSPTPSGVGQGSPSALAALNSSLARLLYVASRYSEALAIAERAINLASDAGIGGVLAEAEVTRGAGLTMVGEWLAGLQALERAVARAEEVGDVFSACRGLQHLSGAYLARGDVRASRDAMARSLSLAERMSNRRQIATTLFGLSIQAFLVGDLEQARGDARRARQYVDELGGFWLRVLHTATLSLAISRQAWSLLPDDLKACIDNSENLGGQHALRQQRMLAEQELDDGKPQAALDRLQGLLESSALQREQVIGVSPLLALAYLAAGDEAQAQAELERALDHASQHSLYIHQPELLRVRGIILAHQGDVDEAIDTLRQAANLANDLPYPYAEARARYDCGRILASAGAPEQAQEELEAALAIFQRLGARLSIDQTEQALGHL